MADYSALREALLEELNRYDDYDENIVDGFLAIIAAYPDEVDALLTAANR